MKLRTLLTLPLLALLCPALDGGVLAAGAQRERLVVEPTEMRHEIGKAWYVELPPGWQATADGVDHPRRSTAVLLEDGRPLGPAHAIHATIRESGGGAYSHWLGLLYFSSSDGSDPRANGREYVLEDRADAAPGARAGGSTSSGKPATGELAPGAGTSTTE
jgi:hypothetical protein